MPRLCVHKAQHLCAQIHGFVAAALKGTLAFPTDLCYNTPPMSTNNPLMRPKRASKRYTLTREDRQLDPREGQLPANGIKVRPVPCKVGGEWKYRLELEGSNDNICELDSLAEELRLAGLNLPVATVKSILDTLTDVIPQYIARTGRSVRIGNLVTLKPFATGLLDNANDKPDPSRNQLEIRATISPSMRHSLNKARLVNEASRAKGIDYVIREADSAVRNEVDAASALLVNGRNIYVTPQPAAGSERLDRVWIETLDGRLLGRCEVLHSGPGLVAVRFVPDAPVDVAEGRLVVETFGTQESAASGDRALLSRYTCDVRFI